MLSRNEVINAYCVALKLSQNHQRFDSKFILLIWPGRAIRFLQKESMSATCSTKIRSWLTSYSKYHKACRVWENHTWFVSKFDIKDSFLTPCSLDEFKRRSIYWFWKLAIGTCNIFFCLISTLYIVATCIFHKNRRPLFVFCNPVLSIPAGGFCV